MEKRNQQRKKKNVRHAYQSISQEDNYTFQDMLNELSDVFNTPPNSKHNSKSEKYSKPTANYSGSCAMNGAKPKSNHSPIASQNLRQNIYSSVNAFVESKDNFSDVYYHWLYSRKLSIEKLETLVEDLHKEQLEFNKAQVACREIGSFSRSAKCQPSTIGTIAGVFALLSDAASGIASIVQAVNVDEYLKKFKEIMDTDEKFTKHLYDARSQCVEEYKGIEEIVRRHHQPTFNSTARKISKDLEVKHLWMAINNAYINDDLVKMLSLIGNFVEAGCQLEILQKIGNSIVTYVDENPAALEACDSAFRIARGAFDLAYIDGEKSQKLSYVARASNQLMIMDDGKQIYRLQRMIDDDSPQSKLEEKMRNTIYFLDFEMKQIVDAFGQQ